MCYYIFYCFIYILSKHLKTATTDYFIWLNISQQTEEEVDNLIRGIFGEDDEHADIVEDDVEIDELPNAESDIDPNIWSNIQ